MESGDLWNSFISPLCRVYKWRNGVKNARAYVMWQREEWSSKIRCSMMIKGITHLEIQFISIFDWITMARSVCECVFYRANRLAFSGVHSHFWCVRIEWRFGKKRDSASFIVSTWILNFDWAHRHTVHQTFTQQQNPIKIVRLHSTYSMLCCVSKQVHTLSQYRNFLFFICLYLFVIFFFATSCHIEMPLIRCDGLLMLSLESHFKQLSSAHSRYYSLSSGFFFCFAFAVWQDTQSA